MGSGPERTDNRQFSVDRQRLFSQALRYRDLERDYARLCEKFHLASLFKRVLLDQRITKVAEQMQRFSAKHQLLIGGADGSLRRGEYMEYDPDQHEVDHPGATDLGPIERGDTLFVAESAIFTAAGEPILPAEFIWHQLKS